MERPVQNQNKNNISSSATPSKNLLDSMQKDKYYSINIIRKTSKKQRNSFLHINQQKSSSVKRKTLPTNIADDETPIQKNSNPDDSIWDEVNEQYNNCSLPEVAASTQVLH